MPARTGAPENVTFSARATSVAERRCQFEDALAWIAAQSPNAPPGSTGSRARSAGRDARRGRARGPRAPERGGARSRGGPGSRAAHAALARRPRRARRSCSAGVGAHRVRSVRRAALPLSELLDVAPRSARLSARARSSGGQHRQAKHQAAASALASVRRIDKEIRSCGPCAAPRAAKARRRDAAASAASDERRGFDDRSRLMRKPPSLARGRRFEVAAVRARGTRRRRGARAAPRCSPELKGDRRSSSSAPSRSRLHGRPGRRGRHADPRRAEPLTRGEADLVRQISPPSSCVPLPWRARGDRGVARGSATTVAETNQPLASLDAHADSARARAHRAERRLSGLPPPSAADEAARRRGAMMARCRSRRAEARVRTSATERFRAAPAAIAPRGLAAVAARAPRRRGRSFSRRAAAPRGARRSGRGRRAGAEARRFAEESRRLEPRPRRGVSPRNRDGSRGRAPRRGDSPRGGVAPRGRGRGSSRGRRRGRARDAEESGLPPSARPRSPRPRDPRPRFCLDGAQGGRREAERAGGEGGRGRAAAAGARRRRRRCGRPPSGEASYAAKRAAEERAAAASATVDLAALARAERAAEEPAREGRPTSGRRLSGRRGDRHRDARRQTSAERSKPARAAAERRPPRGPPPRSAERAKPPPRAVTELGELRAFMRGLGMEHHCAALERGGDDRRRLRAGSAAARRRRRLASPTLDRRAVHRRRKAYNLRGARRGSVPLGVHGPRPPLSQASGISSGGSASLRLWCHWRHRRSSTRRKRRGRLRSPDGWGILRVPPPCGRSDAQKPSRSSGWRPRGSHTFRRARAHLTGGHRRRRPCAESSAPGG